MSDAALSSDTPTVFDLPVTLSDADHHAYRTRETGTVLFQWPDRWISFRGDKAVDALNGLVTNDVGTLRPGESQYAAALSPKGKIVADMRILCVDAHTVFTAVTPAAADAWIALTRKYVNPRLAKVTDEAEHVAWLLAGAKAADAIASISEYAIHESAPDVLVAQVPHGFVLATHASNASLVRGQFEALHPVHGSHQLLDVLRVESGLPQWGVDMDDQTIPQEANLDQLQAISFDKGCYTGQETVARLHFRGHVNRRLRGLRSSQAMRRGARITDATGKDVGDVRSSVISPQHGAIAIAMIRREISADDTVWMVDQDERVEAHVVELPFTGR